MTEMTETHEGRALGAARLDAEEVMSSLTGFDEIAIEQMFRLPVHRLADDGTRMMRALLFVLARRDGASDADAFRTVMTSTLGEVVARFKEDSVTEPGEA